MYAKPSPRSRETNHDHQNRKNKNHTWESNDDFPKRVKEIRRKNSMGVHRLCGKQTSNPVHNSVHIVCREKTLYRYRAY